MRSFSQNACEVKPSDAGLSLIEVIVAIAIVSIVALASASLTINGVSLASSTERQQTAVTIANGAMETASAQPAATIYVGRKLADVTNAFAVSSAVPGVSATKPVGETPPVSAVQALPITPPPITQSGTTYTTTVLVGSCFQSRAGGDCVQVLATGIPMIRVIVIVRWTATKSCAPGGCYYSTTTLIDPSKDLDWVTHD